jgi:DNA-binding XRE family transcriptional regulator
MTPAPVLSQNETIGFKARRLRIACLLSQQKLAELAGVPQEQVDLFEHDFPLPLDNKRKILRVLWAKKIRK